MAKTAQEFLAGKTGGEGISFDQGFDELPIEEQEEVMQQLKQKQKKKGPPTSNAREYGDNGL